MAEKDKPQRRRATDPAPTVAAHYDHRNALRDQYRENALGKKSKK